MLILKQTNGKETPYSCMRFWQCEPDSGLGIFAFTPLIQDQNFRVGGPEGGGAYGQEARGALHDILLPSLVAD